MRGFHYHHVAFKNKIMRKIICIIIIYTLTFCSCDRIKNKTEEFAARTESKVKSKSKDILEIIFPLFDSYEPDTKFNKKRFKEFLNVDISDDVNTLYTFGDFLGADYKILISFKCDSSTIYKIIMQNKMKLSESENDFGLGFSDEFKWWDKIVIEKIKPYKMREKSGDWFYLWYDQNTKTAYCEQFSL
jgi:hypothetical protein